MQIVDDPVMKFDTILPIYNWYYPLVTRRAEGAGGSIDAVLRRVDPGHATSRAFYFHIPFCETICSFCPFMRGGFQGDDVVELYTRALIREIERKARHRSMTAVPVRAIFFGGGTPSVLSPDQIRRIGEAIRSNYDLGRLREFSFEMELKSVRHDKLEALREIGVTHARFGLQTFNPRYRELFALTATLEQVAEAVRLLPRYFPHVSFDILYGMDGQTADELAWDIEQAVATGIKNIDFYPINNVVTQIRLHRAYEAAALRPTSALVKHSMNLALREHMTQRSYLPHNGHGYVEVPPDELARAPVVTDRYSFLYHEHVYGYADHELVGFGAGAITSLNGLTLINGDSRERYTRSLLADGVWDFTAGAHDRRTDATKPVALRLPYHGALDAGRVDWGAVHPETRDALRRAVDAGLMAQGRGGYALTRAGWSFYVNLMYYLSPREEQDALDAFIAERRREPGRRVEDSRVYAVPH